MRFKQFQVLLILVMSGAGLLLFSYFKPYVPSIIFKGKPVEVKFIPFEKMFAFCPKIPKANIDSLLVRYEEKAKEEPVSPQIEGMAAAISLVKDTVLYAPDTTPNLAFTNPEKDGISALDVFFEALASESRTVQIRIAHYGDSKTEGDRISSILRRKFQSKFGGKGVGYVPLVDITSCVSYARIPSGNWRRYTVMHNNYKYGTFGMSGMVFNYTDVDLHPDSASHAGDSAKPVVRYFGKNASVSLHFNCVYDRFKIIYGNAVTPCLVNVYDSKTDKCIGVDTLCSTDEFNIREVPLSYNCLSIKVKFHGQSPDIYGFTFDGDSGIQVDNYGIRGHSGNGLMKINPSLFVKEIAASGTRLIILQYGGNAVPGHKSEQDLKILEDNFYSLYSTIKQRAGNLSVIIVGVGDMGTMINGQNASYPMVEGVRNSQKKAALRANCAFFDLYTMMGGENSILTWVNKGLASLDGHYSSKGEQIAGTQMFQAIMQQYAAYQSKKKN